MTLFYIFENLFDVCFNRRHQRAVRFCIQCVVVSYFG